MGRIRTIKPDFWTDDAITECSLSARLAFIGTWNFADDNGNVDRSAKQLKAKIFPHDDISVEELVQELLFQGLLVEYEVLGRKYLHIKGFAKHQKINRPSAPTCPVYEDSLRTHGVLTEDSLAEGKGRERKGDRSKPKPPPEGPPLTSKPAKSTAHQEEPLLLPDWLPLDAWEGWVANRRAHKKPLTRHAKELAVRKLAEFGRAGHDVREILETSTLNGWQGLFAPTQTPQRRAKDSGSWVASASTLLTGETDDPKRLREDPGTPVQSLPLLGFD